MFYFTLIFRFLEDQAVSPGRKHLFLYFTQSFSGCGRIKLSTVGLGVFTLSYPHSFSGFWRIKLSTIGLEAFAFTFYTHSFQVADARDGAHMGLALLQVAQNPFAFTITGVWGWKQNR
jgi:hypothetical protein